MPVRKPCNYCGKTNHSSLMCFEKPRKSIKKVGKQTNRWLETRRKWVQENPPVDGKYSCHYCGITITLNADDGYSNMTLDHIKPRSTSPRLRNDLDNLVPSCNPCNVLKGSMNYTRFCERYFPHLLEKTTLSDGL